MRKIALAVALLVVINMVFASPVDTATTGEETAVANGSPTLVSNEISCLTGSYKGYLNGQTIILEIIDARYNNLFSFKGTISGYVKYKNKVYPVKGSLRYKASEKCFEVNVGMVEYDAQNKISFDIDGSITCYRDGTGRFKGSIITPGKNHPEMQDIVLKK